MTSTISLSPLVPTLSLMTSTRLLPLVPTLSLITSLSSQTSLPPLGEDNEVICDKVCTRDRDKDSAISDDQTSLGDARECSNTEVSLPIDRNCLIQEVILSNCNWFQFCDAIEEQCGIEFASALDTVYDSLVSSNELDDGMMHRKHCLSYLTSSMCA